MLLMQPALSSLSKNRACQNAAQPSTTSDNCQQLVRRCINHLCLRA